MGLEALIEHLKIIPDWRRGRRQVKYPLWLMLLMSLLGVMSGYTSLPGLADFMQRHQSEVVELFGVDKAALAKYSTIGRMTHHVNGTEVARILEDWANQVCPVKSGEAIAMDGKALASTGTHWSDSEQNFVMVVSACIHGHGWVITQESFHNVQK
ncbi:MAG: transposase family protein [Cyanobacteria bacterium P01_E01_bin.6]